MSRPGLRQRVALPIVALLAAGALGVVLLEALLRAVPIAAIEIHRRAPAAVEGATLFEYDPRLGWRGRGGIHSIFSGWEFTSDVRHNARGFRDVEVDEARTPGVFRVVLLGDSITWGHGVEQAERYGDLLRAGLRAAGVAVQVVNLAVAGYGTDQELLLWEAEGRRYCADLVLLGLYDNDVRENAAAVQGRYPKPYFRPSADGALALDNVPVPRVPDAAPAPSRGRLRTWLRQHLRVWAALAFVRQALRGSDAAATTLPEPSRDAIELTAALMRRLAASVRDDGAAFGVVVLPDLHYGTATMRAVGASGVVAALDLSPVFRAAGVDGGPLFYRLDGAHWTPRAHRIAAEAIGRWIVASRLLPPSPRGCGAAR